MKIKAGTLLIAVIAAAGAATAAFADDDDGDSFRFTAVLTGAQEVPESGSDALGRVKVRFDQGLTSADVRLRLKGIDSIVFAAHFHCNRAGLNGPPAFGIMSPGQLVEINERARLTLTNADAVGDCVPVVGRPVNNIAALYFAMRDGLIYVNVHTANHPPGAIRGQLIADD